MFIYNHRASPGAIHIIALFRAVEKEMNQVGSPRLVFSPTAKWEMFFHF
jgi:hypothetical protein